jgi:4-amino-4-deoxy-L-arabinose transferase-like glycosyltransferase
MGPKDLIDSAHPAPKQSDGSNPSIISILFFGSVALGLIFWRGFALERAGLSLHFDEAQYWVWSSQLDWGYYSKPPVIAVIYRAVSLLCGDEAWVYRSASGLVYALAAGLVGLIARDSFGSRYAIPSALVFATIPGIAVSGGFLTTDAPLVFCWALALWSLQRACGRNAHLRDWCLLGVATGIGLMSKYTMGAFAVSTLGWLAASPQRRAHLARIGPWCSLLIASLLFAPNLFWNAQHGFPTLGHTQEISQLDRAGLHPLRLIEFVLGQWIVGGPLLIIMGSLSLAGVFGKIRLVAPTAIETRLSEVDAISLHQWFAFPLLLIACAEATLSRAQPNWALPAYVSLTILLVTVTLRQRGLRTLVSAIALNLFILAGFVHWPSLRQAIGLQAGARGDLFARFYGWPEFAHRLESKLEPDMLLVNDERGSLALLAYELRLPMNRIASWNPEGRHADHWSRFLDLSAVARPQTERATSQRYLIVSATLDPNDLMNSFEQVVAQPDDRGPGCEACAKPWKVWLAQGFRGYQPHRLNAARPGPTP